MKSTNAFILCGFMAVLGMAMFIFSPILSREYFVVVSPLGVIIALLSMIPIFLIEEKEELTDIDHLLE